MPPKVQVSKQIILEKAYTLTRQGGPACFTARSLAAALGCSTQPIYAAFGDMRQLQQAVAQKAAGEMMRFLKAHAEASVPQELSLLLGYVRFSDVEPQLFRLLFASGPELLTQAFSAFAPVSLPQDALIYANGVIMMSAFGALPLSWTQKRRRLMEVFEKLL